MLLQFAATNHRSIKETAVISMKASADKMMRECLITPDNKKYIVPVMALYGANAAGKSNVLHALLLMREMICGIYAKPLKAEALPQEPFAFSENVSETTTFEIIYYYKGIKYAYGYSFDKQRIHSEYLYHWPNGREALIFSRDNGKYEFRENIQEQTVLAGRTPENRLYLTSSNEWNLSQTENAYLWFKEKICGLLADNSASEVTLESIRNGGTKKQRIIKEMMFADLGISDVTVSGSQENPMITTIHQVKDESGKIIKYPLLLRQESMGTQRFFSRIGSWLEAMEFGSILIVDEIEASMHPLLTRHLIEMMQDPLININQAQLIFTTHDTGLLDLTLLRRDQIWFAEKDESTMQTEIYALTEFSPRKGENIAKGYLQGRFGAIPFVGGELSWEE